MKKKNERRAKDETPASDEPNRRARAGEDGFRCAAFRGRGVRPPRVRRRRDRASRCAGRGKRRRPRTAGVRRTRRDHLHHGHGVRRARGGVLRARRAESEGRVPPGAPRRAARGGAGCAGGRGWRLRRRLRRLAVGPLRGRRCRIVDSQGVRVEGTGVVTRADAKRDSYRVRWSRELSDTFTYRPVAGGPLLRARRRPGPKRGWRREDLLAETHPAEARAEGPGGARDCLASPRGFSAARPAPSARALEGLWVATWHASGDPDDGVSSTTFELALELIESSASSPGADDSIVARLRSTEGAEPAASASAHLATRRFAMEIGTVDATRGFAAEAFFDGIVAFDEDARLTVTGGWLGADGAFAPRRCDASDRRRNRSERRLRRKRRVRETGAPPRGRRSGRRAARARGGAPRRARRGRTGSSRRFAPEAARASSWKTAKTTSSPRTRTARRRRIRRTFRLATENILGFYLFRMSSVISYVAGVYSLDYGNAWTAFAAMRANIASAKPGARAASRSSASCSKTITEHPRVSCANASKSPRGVVRRGARFFIFFFRLRRRLARRGVVKDVHLRLERVLRAGRAPLEVRALARETPGPESACVAPESAETIDRSLANGSAR